LKKRGSTITRKIIGIRKIHCIEHFIYIFGYLYYFLMVVTTGFFLQDFKPPLLGKEQM